jgi:hypothetical protein
VLYGLQALFGLTGSHVDPAKIVEALERELILFSQLLVLVPRLPQLPLLYEHLRQSVANRTLPGVEPEHVAVALLGGVEIVELVELEVAQHEVRYVVVRVPAYRLPQGGRGILVVFLLLEKE